MSRIAAPFFAVVLAVGCDSNQRTPSPPPVPDIALPSAAADVSVEPETGGSAAVPLDELRAPIAEHLMEFLPETLDGVAARRRQAIKTSPVVHGFYEGEKRKVYNLQLAGPSETESTRRSRYPLLGVDDKQTSGTVESKGFKIGEYPGQRTYDSKRKRSEAVLLVNPFVEVKLNVAPTDKPDEATALIETLDLTGLSKLR